MGPDVEKSDWQYQPQGREASELSALLARISELEKRITYLERRPAQYVPPPTFGPLPDSKINPVEITPEMATVLKEMAKKLPKNLFSR